MYVSIVWCWGVNLPLFSVEESKDVLAGHESLLNISQFQVIHWQHVLLLLLLKKGISNKSLAAPGEASVQSAERRLSATQAAHHQGGTGKHSQPRLGTADKFSCYPSVIHTELHASTTQKSLTPTRAPSASFTNTEKPAKELLNAWHCTTSSVLQAPFPPPPKTAGKKVLGLQASFPYVPHKQTSHTLLQHLLRDHQHWGHAGPIPKTHREVTACSVLHHKCWARRAQYELSCHIQSVICSPHSPLLSSQCFSFFNFIFKSLKTSDQCSRKARHVIEKLFWHTLGTIST